MSGTEESSVSLTDGSVMAAMMTMQRGVSEAQHVADTAKNAVASHEAICAERYANIKSKLENITLLFDKVDKIKTIVYIGVGIWIGIPVIAGFMYGLWNVIKGAANGH